MSRLHELAREYGVETHNPSNDLLRNPLTIAHELLGKLSSTAQWTINHVGGQHWSWFWTMAETGTCTFTECVEQLAERAREGRG